jgi:uncharacterized membrane protein YvbJ
MVFCTKCGTEAAADDSFCRVCGAPRAAGAFVKADLNDNPVERHAKIRLKREHDKLIAGLGVLAASRLLSSRSRSSS